MLLLYMAKLRLLASAKPAAESRSSRAGSSASHSIASMIASGLRDRITIAFAGAPVSSVATTGSPSAVLNTDSLSLR